MTTVPQVFIVVLLVIVNFACGKNFAENVAEAQKITGESVKLEEINDITTQSSLSNKQLESTQKVPSVESLKVEDHKVSYAEGTGSHNSQFAESELVQIILKDATLSINSQEDNSTKYILKAKPNSLNSLAVSRSPNIGQIVLKDESEELVERFTESLVEVIASTSADYELTPKPLDSLEAYRNSNLADSSLVQIVLQDFTNLSNKQEELQQTSTGSLFELTTQSQHLNLPEKESVEIVLKDVTKLTNKKDELEENSSGSLLESTTKAQNFSLPERQLVQIVLQDFTNLSNKKEELQETSTGSLLELTTESQHLNLPEKESIEIVLKDVTKLTNKKDELAENSALLELTTKSQKFSLPERQSVQIVLQDVSNLSNKQEELQETSTGSLLELTTQSQHLNLPEKESVEIVLKDVTKLTNKKDELEENSSGSLLELTTKAQNFSLPEKQSAQIVLQDVNNLSNKQEELQETSTGSLLELTTEYQNLNLPKKESVEIILKDVVNLTNKQEVEENFTESVVEFNKTTASVEHELTQKPFFNLEASQSSNIVKNETLQVVLKESANLASGKEKLEESFSESIVEITAEHEATAKSLITLEEYAVKQMNFMLNHLLGETQVFVAEVLQATVNSVFPRDHLKRYAESLNRLLNPHIDSDYSDEALENVKLTTPDEIYEEIIQKLNFLKSKPSKFLQKSLPQDWVNDYRNKREELAIWLDKATEQMHKEFNSYITVEEDHIKYQYFNETFDDISRATEIHHKLALLADLVKIVKNKKQITFMDLYMQT